MARHTGGKKTAGGLSKIEPFYGLFNGARKRITDTTNKDHHRYGGRGLTFEWPDYIAFKKDMYKSYLKHCEKYGKNNTSLERIDNDKGYSKENCRWATLQEQAKNRRTSKYITYKGKTMIVADWAKKLGVSRQTVGYRLRNGWDFESIISVPLNHNNVYDNRTKTVRTSKKVRS